MLRVLFKCVEVSDHATIAELKATVGDKSSCHVKGFSFGIQPNVPDIIIDRISEVEFICWDGDSLAIDSFTQLIPLAICRRLRSGLAPPLLWAAKTKPEESILLSSWHNKVVHIDESDKILIIREISQLSSTEQSEAIVITLRYSLFDLHANDYVSLAASMHHLSGCGQIIAFGGGEGLRCEFEQTQENNRRLVHNTAFENPYRYPDKIIKWVIFPYSRHSDSRLQHSFSHGMSPADNVEVIVVSVT